VDAGRIFSGLAVRGWALEALWMVSRCVRAALRLADRGCAA